MGLGSNNLKNLFVTFLKERNLMLRYKRAAERKINNVGYSFNIGHAKYFTWEQALNAIITYSNGIGIFDCTILWDETDEGPMFWSKNSDDFDQILIDMYNTK